mmetsp:Transcript_1960/g.4309  ORF Transcript_1960/g.4309 Transcript_1960/m.4309 type:complete len:104 (-) Transcript_1960:49-360(-)
MIWMIAPVNVSNVRNTIETLGATALAASANETPHRSIVQQLLELSALVPNTTFFARCLVYFSICLRAYSKFGAKTTIMIENVFDWCNKGYVLLKLIEHLGWSR